MSVDVSSKALSVALGRLYDCVLTPSLWPEALSDIATFVGGTSALLFRTDYRSRSGLFFQSFNAEPEWTRRYFEQYIRINPVLPYMAFMDPGTCTSFLKVIDEDEYRRSAFYNEWAAPQGLLDVVVGILDRSATVSGIIGVSGLKSGLAASDEEIARMELIAPHVQRAALMAGVFEGLHADRTALGDAVRAASDIMVVLDASGSVLLASSGASALEPGEPIQIKGSSLSIADAAASDHLRSLLRGAVAKAGAGAAGTIDFGPSPRGGRMTATAVPLAGARATRGFPDRGVLLLALRRVRDDAPPDSVFAQRFGLTPRELQVLVGVIQIGGVPEVARLYGLSATTVRTHLQKVFDKTGVRRQTDLVKLALQHGLGGPVPPPAASPQA